MGKTDMRSTRQMDHDLTDLGKVWFVFTVLAIVGTFFSRNFDGDNIPSFTGGVWVVWAFLTVTALAIYVLDRVVIDENYDDDPSGPGE